MTVPKTNLRRKLRLFVGMTLFSLLILPAALIVFYLVKIEDAIYAKGIVIPEDTYEIVAHVDAKVLDIRFHTGEAVRKGDVIAELDAREFRNEESAILSEVNELQAEVEVKKSELELLKKEPLPAELWHSDTDLQETADKAKKAKEKLNRFHKLLDSNAISRIEYEKAELESIQAEADYKRAGENARRVRAGLAEKNIAKAQKALELVRVKLQSKHDALRVVRKKITDCRILSPADGHLTELPCKKTFYVERGRLAAVVAGGDLMLRAGVDERFVRKIAIGQKAHVSSEVFTRLQYGNFDATVVKIGVIPIEDGTSGPIRYPVYLRMDADGCDIKIGSQAEAAIVTGKRPALFALLNLEETDEIAERRRLSAASGAASADRN